MPSLKEELEEVKLKYSALREEWGLQQEHLGRLQSQISGLHNQLQQQSAFCASLGAIFGHLLWKASRSSEIVDSITSGVSFLLKQYIYSVFFYISRSRMILGSKCLKHCSVLIFFHYRIELATFS